MFEAVNSVVSNAPLLRGNSDKISIASLAADQNQQAAAPKAPYISPYIFVDPIFDKAVIQIRNSDTGDVLSQFPSKGTLERRATEGARQSASHQQPSGDIPIGESDITVPGIVSSQSTSNTAVSAQIIGSSEGEAPQSQGTDIMPQQVSSTFVSSSQPSAEPVSVDTQA